MLRLSTFLIFFSFVLQAFAQDKISISGYVKDASSGEVLIGATLQVKSNYRAVRTNTYGFFSLELEQANDSLFISYVGYQPLAVEVNAEPAKKDIPSSLTPIWGITD
ncbi:carboxypeptidase-like regulatory domain-containing protein [Sphingobacterium sp. T2]|uniref:carboxypeptidase-like regulatory domain-containing protein n=1 Tax=Sphingobacterium sp. T2 TaxID=1590596 RepID=UPI00057B86D6|nr:carboxypeptidase-like regulatory domain-containing protein [Sphingobacterium sp. T2]